jgi:hypothetical protein
MGHKRGEQDVKGVVRGDVHGAAQFADVTRVRFERCGEGVEHFIISEGGVSSPLGHKQLELM